MESIGNENIATSTEERASISSTELIRAADFLACSDKKIHRLEERNKFIQCETEWTMEGSLVTVIPDGIYATGMETYMINEIGMRRCTVVPKSENCRIIPRDSSLTPRQIFEDMADFIIKLSSKELADSKVK